MSLALALGLGAIAFFLALEGFFSGSEIALVNADRVRLKAHAEDGDANAALALTLLEDEPRLLGTCLIGTNICVVSGSAIATGLLVSFGVTSSWAITLAFAPAVLIFGEALPKTIMQHHADTVAPRVARPLRVFASLFSPFLAVVDLWNRALTGVFGDTRPDESITREELIDLLDEEASSPIDPEERRLIMGLLSLTESTVEACMTPLIRVVGVNEHATIGVAADMAVRTNHSRLPVYRQRIDHVVGLVHQADLLFMPDDAAAIDDVVRPVRFVPEGKRADDLFQEMRENREHFVVVVDEYGGCVGIVTLEDLLEVFVGEIADEREDVAPTLQRLEDGSWHVPGNTELDEVIEATGLDLPEGGYETLAGLVLTTLGHIPEAGEQIELPGAVIVVDDASDRAIRGLRLRLTDAA
jgi:CBS domain containing-hemolysin-like protein